MSEWVSSLKMSLMLQWLQCGARAMQEQVTVLHRKADWRSAFAITAPFPHPDDKQANKSTIGNVSPS